MTANRAFRSFNGVLTSNLTQEEQLASHQLEKQRVIVENAFSLLKVFLKVQLFYLKWRKCYYKKFLVASLIHDLIIDSKN